MNTQTLVTAPTAVASLPNIDRVAKVVSYYTNGKASAVIFRNGSCAFPPLGENAVSNSVSLLRALPQALGFEVREMDDSSFIVSFSDHVFSVVFSDDMQKIRDEVSKEIDQSGSTEALLGKPGASPDHLLIGIIARTRLLQDIGEPIVAASIGTKPA